MNDLMISVDPGLSGTGVSIFRWDSEFQDLIEPPIATCILHSRSQGEFHQRGLEIADRLHTLLAQYREAGWNPCVSYVELSEFHEGAGGVMVAAAGDLVRLTVTIGMIAGALHYSGVRFVPVPVQTWKGQTSKRVCWARAADKLQRAGHPWKYRSHEADAVALGLFVKSQGDVWRATHE